MLIDCHTLKDGGAQSHKIVAPSPLSPAGVAGTWQGWAHPQAGLATPLACLQSPQSPQPTSCPGPAQGAVKPQMVAAQLPRAGPRHRQASDGGCPSTQDLPSLR